MLVTINTDASFHPDKKIAGYAFWAVSDRFKIQKSGVFKDLCKDSHEAEIKCILNAMHVILHGHTGITTVIINTDSMNAINILGGVKAKIKKHNLYWGSTYRALYLHTIKSCGNCCRVELRHVKAHSGVQDKRSFVNEWCDSRAKDEMRKAVYG